MQPGDLRTTSLQTCLHAVRQAPPVPEAMIRCWVLSERA